MFIYVIYKYCNRQSNINHSNINLELYHSQINEDNVLNI